LQDFYTTDAICLKKVLVEWLKKKDPDTISVSGSFFFDDIIIRI